MCQFRATPAAAGSRACRGQRVLGSQFREHVVHLGSWRSTCVVTGPHEVLPSGKSLPVSSRRSRLTSRAVRPCYARIALFVKHPLLFEISAWPWLERLSRREHRVVTLADVPANEWDSIAERGFSFVFLMGVWKRSPLGRELALADRRLRVEYDHALPGWTPRDVVGSPYCISAYEPDSRMGGWDGLDTARAQLNRRGIGLVLDFVPNHTAFDHPWTSAYPDRYVLGTVDDVRRAAADFRRVGASMIACGRDPFFPRGETSRS